MSNARQIACLAVVWFGLPLCFVHAQEDKRAAVVAHYKRAEDALSKGHSEIAEEEFKAILVLDPTNAQAFANVGVIHFKRNDFSGAKDIFEKALLRNSTLWDAKALLGLCEVRLGETGPGLALLEESFSRIHNLDVKLDAGIAIITAHQATKTLGAATTVMQDLEEALPNNPNVLYVTYRAYSELAAERLGTLAKIAPESARTYQVYGEASMTQDEFAKASAEFRKAIALDPNLPGIHYELGMAVLTNAQDVSARREARTAFETELQRDPTDFHSEYELGEICRLDSKMEEAQEHYSRALRLQPAFAEAQVGLGVVLAQQGNESESVEHFVLATRLDPDNEVAHYRLSKLYRSLGRVAEADRELQTFQRLHDIHEARTTSSAEVPLQRSAADSAK